MSDIEVQSAGVEGGVEYELAPQTVAFFQALAHLRRTYGTTRLSFRMQQLAQRTDTREGIVPVERFNMRVRQHDIPTAIAAIDLENPSGIPVEVVEFYHETGETIDAPGHIVAVLDEHGSQMDRYFSGLAVADFGQGPSVHEVTFSPETEGFAYLK